MIETPTSRPEFVAPAAPFLVEEKKTPSPSEARLPQILPTRVQAKAKTIFVIDDESSIADSLQEILNGHGYQALAFYSGRSAIEAARKQCPDFVLCDVVMPKLDGVDTVIAISKFCPRTRIVLFSGQATTSDILAKGRDKGFVFELLPKPIHPDRLLKKLAALKECS